MSVINLQNIRQAEGLMDNLHDVRLKLNNVLIWKNTQPIKTCFFKRKQNNADMLTGRSF